jgi:hypothetical protein
VPVDVGKELKKSALKTRISEVESNSTTDVSVEEIKPVSVKKAFWWSTVLIFMVSIVVRSFMLYRAVRSS